MEYVCIVSASCPLLVMVNLHTETDMFPVDPTDNLSFASGQRLK